MARNRRQPLAADDGSDNNSPRDERPTDDERSDDMVDTAVDAETALEEAEDAVEDAEDALNASGPEVLPLDDPRIIRAYETLADLDAKGANHGLEVAYQLRELTELGQTGRDIAAHSVEYGIAGCTNQSVVVRMVQLAEMMDFVRQDDPEFPTVTEGAARRLLVTKDPLGVDWPIEERAERLGRARQLADLANQAVTRGYVKQAIEEKYPKAERVASTPLAPRVRKGLTGINKLVDEVGEDAYRRAHVRWDERHKAPADSAESDSE